MLPSSSDLHYLLARLRHTLRRITTTTRRAVNPSARPRLYSMTPNPWDMVKPLCLHRPLRININNNTINHTEHLLRNLNLITTGMAPR
jgi:hypothetical protein